MDPLNHDPLDHPSITHPTRRLRGIFFYKKITQKAISNTDDVRITRDSQDVYRYDNKNDKLTLSNGGDTQQSSADKLVALEFPIELEFRNVGF